jgi:hypothetical protein
MSSGTGSFVNIIDMAQSQNANGDISDIAQLLSQCNAVNTDLPMRTANERFGHETAFSTEIPRGVFIGYNTGAPNGKFTNGRVRFSMGHLAQSSQVDARMARDMGNWKAYRAQSDEAFLMGMGQTIENTIIYGNEAFNPREFTGLAGIYNTLNPAAQNARNILSGGGIGSSNTSMWLVDYAKSVYGIAPPGSSAGIEIKDYGDTIPGRDVFGNPFAAYLTLFDQTMGFVVEDWRQVVRLANIDTTTAGLQGPNAIDLFSAISAMLNQLPSAARGVTNMNHTDAPRESGAVFKAAFYYNRGLQHALEVQSTRNRNVLMQVKDYDGMVISAYRGVPMKVTDQISSFEAAITTSSGPI